MASGSSATQFQQLDVNSYLTSMAISPLGDYLSFGDADGQLHLWTTHETDSDAPRTEDGGLALPPFNGYDGVEPVWPDPVEPLRPIAWEGKT